MFQSQKLVQIATDYRICIIIFLKEPHIEHNILHNVMTVDRRLRQ